MKDLEGLVNEYLFSIITIALLPISRSDIDCNINEKPGIAGMTFRKAKLNVSLPCGRAPEPLRGLIIIKSR